MRGRLALLTPLSQVAAVSIICRIGFGKRSNKGLWLQLCSKHGRRGIRARERRVGFIHMAAPAWAGREAFLRLSHSSRNQVWPEEPLSLQRHSALRGSRERPFVRSFFRSFLGSSSQTGRQNQGTNQGTTKERTKARAYGCCSVLFQNHRLGGKEGHWSPWPFCLLDCYDPASPQRLLVFGSSPCLLSYHSLRTMSV